MALNLNGSFLFPLIHRNRVLIKHYSKTLIEPLDFVRSCLLRVWEAEGSDY